MHMLSESTVSLHSAHPLRLIHTASEPQQTWPDAHKLICMPNLPKVIPLITHTYVTYTDTRPFQAGICSTQSKQQLDDLNHDMKAC